MCILIQYLDEQQHFCRRQCYTLNDQPAKSAEWGQLALEMQQWAGDHAARCASCKKEAPKETVA